MRSSILLSFSVLLFLVSCSGINSEGDTAYVPDEPTFEKPRCSFKATNNCWTKSIALLSACLDTPAPNDPDVFYSNKKFCSNNSGKLIQFMNPLAIPDANQIEFIVHNSRRECFHFIGDKKSFTIDDLEYGKLSVDTLENGDIQVQCFFGEKFTVPAEAVEKGCHGVPQKAADFIPKASFFAFQENEDLGYQFIFQGIGSSPQTIFKCYE